MKYNINLVREDALTTSTYWQRLSWEQLCQMAEQAYLKLDSCLDLVSKHPINSGRYIDAKVKADYWNEVTSELSKYLRREIPAWMYEEVEARVSQALSINGRSI